MIRIGFFAFARHSRETQRGGGLQMWFEKVLELVKLVGIPKEGEGERGKASKGYKKVPDA